MQPAQPGATPGAAAPPDLFSAALERIRGGAATDLTQSQIAYDAQIGDLRRRFIDPNNQFSEASKIALGEKVARKQAMGAASRAGSLFDGSTINAENLISDQTAEQKQEMMLRYNDLVGAATSERGVRDAAIRQRIEDAEIENAWRIADDPSLTPAPILEALGGGKAPPKPVSRPFERPKFVGPNRLGKPKPKAKGKKQGKLTKVHRRPARDRLH